MESKDLIVTVKWWGIEVLDTNSSAVRLDHFKSPPVVRAILKEMCEGTGPFINMAYKIHNLRKMEPTEMTTEIQMLSIVEAKEVYLVDDWEPFEFSSAINAISWEIKRKEDSSALYGHRILLRKED